jgi:hypothetical protein
MVCQRVRAIIVAAIPDPPAPGAAASSSRWMLAQALVWVALSAVNDP